MEPEDMRVENEELFPLAAFRDPVTAPDALAEGPVRFLLVSGDLIDGTRGGFIVAPQAIWQGSEMARSFRGALSRSWHAEDVYRYWQRQVGAAGSLMIDPQQHADTLFQVARRVGAL